MMELDPYAPPQNASSERQVVVNESALRELVVAWERLRLVYNVILLVPGLVIESIWVTGQGMPLGVAFLGAGMIAVGANIAYFLGPLAELYFRGVFRNGESIGRGRMLIFGLGLLVSAGVFALALLVSLI